MNRIKKIILPIIFVTIGFILGGVIMILFLFHNSLGIDNKISLSIDVFGIISIVVTALLAIYVTSELTKKVQDDRSVKDLAVARIGRVEVLMTDKLREIYKNPELDFVKKTLNNFRSIARNEHKLLSDKGLVSSNSEFNELIRITDKLWDKLLFVEAGGGGVTFDTDSNLLIFSDEIKEFIVEENNKVSLHIFNIQSDISTK